MKSFVLLLAILTCIHLTEVCCEKQVLTKNQDHMEEEDNLDSLLTRWVPSVLSQGWVSSERTIDLSSLGIDLGAVFDRLLSPVGIVNQFALSIIIQLMFIVGYIVTGVGYGLLLARTPAGPLLDALKYFDVHLGPQVFC